MFFRLLLAAGTAGGLVSCSSTSSWWNNGEYEYVEEVDDSMFNGQSMTESEAQTFADSPAEAAKVFNKRVPPLNSLIVCRDKQCAPAELSSSREYIFNALAHIIDNNLDATALLCEANPQAHTCINPYLTVPAKVGVTPAYVFFDGVKLVDVSVAKGKTALNMALGYNLSYNGQTPTVCKPDTAMMYVKSNNEIMLNGNGFKCEMTSMGTTTIRVMFSIDYIDLDYGYIGGYYSIGLSGPANGGGSGYGLIRLPKDAHPLNPELKVQASDKNKTALPKATVKPVIPTIPSAVEKTSVPQAQPEKALKNTLAAEQAKNGRGGEYGNKANAVKITPETVVKSDKVILKSENPQELRPYEPKSYETEPKFEEIYIDDLDEYIK